MWVKLSECGEGKGEVGSEKSIKQGGALMKVTKLRRFLR
jgi:hypothetical protein